MSTKLKGVNLLTGTRTTFIKFRGVPGPFAAGDMAVAACRDLLHRDNIDPESLDEVIAGCMVPSVDEANIGRQIAVRIGCGNQTPGWTVQRNCASGLQAIDSACQDILTGRHHFVLAGGVEAMSRAPLLYSPEMTEWFMKLGTLKTLGARLKWISRLRPRYFKPVIALLRGLTDPLVGLSMGQTAENLAFRFQITRDDMDAFALESHRRLVAASDAGYFNDERVTLFDKNGRFYAEDDGMRRDANLEGLGKLPPYFDKKFGAVTAGNSSQISDGAAFVTLASDAEVKKRKAPVLARILGITWAGLDPAEMGLGPAHAIALLLEQHQLSLKDIDYFELNEAFAAQVIACVRAMADDNYCKNVLHLPKALGEIPYDRINVDGGAISIGHPVGASGARITLHLAHLLRRQKARYGIASLCIGGGQGGAILLENPEFGA